MRNEFAASVARQGKDPACFFLTGDLGFAALEPVRDAFGDRFLNVGVAEQNLVGVAAGIARAGGRVYAYSIASFASLRAVEHLYLDVVSAGLDVCLVGNGGGYGYGHMGPTHHALRDLGVLTAIGMECLVPAFATEIAMCVDGWSGPTYLRLGRDATGVAAPVTDSTGLAPVLLGSSGHVVALGPLAGLALNEFAPLPPEARPTVWSCTRLPLPELPAAMTDGQPILIVEEHHAVGGLGQHIAHAMLLGGHHAQFAHVCAAGYPSGRYGSQDFHRRESGLDGASMRRRWSDLVF